MHEIRRVSPRIELEALCWEVVGNREQSALCVDISSEGVRAAPEESLPPLIPWSEIERIDARGGSPARGGLVGGIVGAGGGIGLGFIAALADESGGHPLTTILGVTALMAASGAIVGAGVGSLFPGWVKVYPGRLERSSSWGFTSSTRTTRWVPPSTRSTCATPTL